MIWPGIEAITYVHVLSPSGFKCLSLSIICRNVHIHMCMQNLLKANYTAVLVCCYNPRTYPTNTTIFSTLEKKNRKPGTVRN